jgi:type II secretory pathway pseudopilin PulG
MLDSKKDAVAMKKRKYHRGDTIIEVTFAITVFAMVSILAVTMMNRGLATSTASLQTALARQEIDAQAEAIRFIHDAYRAERNLPAANRIYTPLWNSIASRITEQVPRFPSNSSLMLQGVSCTSHPNDQMSEDFFHNANQFVVNSRLIDPGHVSRTVITSQSLFATASVFPRVVFGTSALSEESIANEILSNHASTQATIVRRVEGLWVQAVRVDGSPVIDFHIRACWHSPGSAVISTLGTIVRMYDADFN